MSITTKEKGNEGKGKEKIITFLQIAIIYAFDGCHRIGITVVGHWTIIKISGIKTSGKSWPIGIICACSVPSRISDIPCIANIAHDQFVIKSVFVEERGWCAEDVDLIGSEETISNTTHNTT